jgi:murein DD-endopeptidase MepM/ murein hydrolase activator NlpD
MRTTNTAGAAVGNASRQARLRLAAILITVGVLATGTIVATDNTAAYAVSYPSWADVIAARNNTAASAKAVADIQLAIAGLDANVTATQADADAKGKVYAAAFQSYQEAVFKQQQLQGQVDAAAKASKQSEEQAGQFAAQLARSGSNGLALNLFLNGGKASNLLDGLGNAGKVSERANGISEKAVQDKKTAQALTDEADVKSKILDGLKTDAATALAAAQKAATDAATALAASEAHKTELQAQLAALTTQQSMTEASYQQGAAIAAAAAAAEAAARGAGVVQSSGWARPAVGVITAPYGMRSDPDMNGAWRLHTGTDIAHGCLVPIYAAHSGTVTYAGYLGSFGYEIAIDDGDGYGTAYAHIAAGQMFVGIGQHVNAGQNIARTGMTGGATGCHLHFEVRVNGVAVNAQPFMQARGITLG